MSKIPPHAACVFKGIVYDVYHWEQEMFDGTTTTFECLKRANTVFTLPILPNGHVLYAKQEQPAKPPFLSLFGGRANEGEEPLETAKRELLEETGMVAKDWKLLRTYGAPSKLEWNLYFYVAYGCERASDVALDGGEKIEIIETTLDDFLENIVPNPQFAEYEIRQEVFSALNPAALDKLKREIV